MATSAATAAAAPATEAREFGLSAEQISKMEAKPAPKALAAVTAAVATVRKLPSGYLLVSLDNDQVWAQTEIDPKIWLEPGDQVTIRRGAAGSYLLIAPSKYSTHVRRIR